MDGHFCKTFAQAISCGVANECRLEAGTLHWASSASPDRCVFRRSPNICEAQACAKQQV